MICGTMRARTALCLILSRANLAKPFTRPSRHPFERTMSSLSATAAESAADSSSSSSTGATTSRAATIGPPPLILSLQSHLGSKGDDDDNSKIRLILASQSPRRKEILDMMGLQGLFDAMPSPLNETALQLSLNNSSSSMPSPMEYTQTLAQEKAKALAVNLLVTDETRCGSQAVLVLGSDTIVELDGRILEKPKDTADAQRMLQSLSGRQHKVHTGVALYRVLPKQSDAAAVLQASFVDTAVVQFAELSDEDIDAYIATKEPMDKAGAYGIQGIGGQFVSRIEGDFFTVMGLPMHPLSRELASAVSYILAKR